MNEEKQVLRVRIDGHWEASEFAMSLSALDHLYTLRFGLALEVEELRELRDFYLDGPFSPLPRSMRDVRRWAKLAPSLVRSAGGPVGRRPVHSLLEPDERLVVRRVIYGSPGLKDLLGVGEIVGHVKDLLIRLIDLWSTRRQRSLEDDRRALENQQLQVGIARDFVGVLKEAGYSKRELRQVVASVVHEQKPLVGLIAAGKIISADTIDASQS